MGHADVAPAELAPNPRNWRTHPREQQRALAGALGEIGWVAEVIVNRSTGRVVDGHLRIELALDREEATVPVTYVELSEDEERLVLASLDPIGAMADAEAGDRQAARHDSIAILCYGTLDTGSDRRHDGGLPRSQLRARSLPRLRAARSRAGEKGGR